MRTPNNVTSEASTSSAVSASEPSIATEPVATAAWILRTSRNRAVATLASAARVVSDVRVSIGKRLMDRAGFQPTRRRFG